MWHRQNICLLTSSVFVTLFIFFLIQQVEPTIVQAEQQSHIPSTTPVAFIEQQGANLVVTWEPVVGADHYNIYRGVVPYFPLETPYAAMVSSPFSDLGAGNGGNRFYYMVMAVAADGTETPSNQVSKFTFGLNGTAVDIAPDLQLTMSADATTAAPGSLLSYTLTYSNRDGETATGVVITEMVPANATFNAGASAAGWQQMGATNEYTFPIGDVAFNETGSVTFAVDLMGDWPAGPTSLTNTASIADDGSHGTDTNPANNGVSETTTVSTGPTAVCGTISSSTTWTAVASPYIVNCNLTINSGVTLTLEPGTTVQFGTNVSAIANGQLDAQGTEEYPITFTSDAASPARGDWRGVCFEGSSGGSILDYVTVEYGGSGLECGSWNNLQGNIIVTVDGVTIENSTIAESSSYGIHVRDGDATIRNSEIKDNGNYGIYSYSGGTVVIDGNDISENGNGPITLIYTTASVTNNSMSDDNDYSMVSANSSSINNLTMSGNIVSGEIVEAILVTGGTLSGVWEDYGVPYVVWGTINTSTWTLKPGVEIRARSGARINVNGVLDAQGLDSNPITFTSDAASPARGDWRGVCFEGSSGGSILDYVTVEYGGQTTSCDGSSRSANIIVEVDNVTITNSVIINSSGRGIVHRHSGTSFTVTGSIIANNSSYGIWFTSSSSGNVILKQNIIVGNGTYGVRNDRSNIIDATDNYWGSISGPGPEGSGNGVSFTPDCSTDPCAVALHVIVWPWLDAEGAFGGDAPNVAYAGDPVNTANGNFVYERTELFIETRGIPLDFSRAYNSLAPKEGPLGWGWRHNWMMSVEDSLSGVRVTYGNGRQIRFTWNGSEYVPTPGVFSTLTKSGGVFHLTEKNKMVYHFDVSGRLASVEDNNGNTTTLTYSNDRLMQVTEPTGRSLDFTYDGNGRLSQIEDVINRTVQFGYDANGDLALVIDPLGHTTTMTYDAEHHLLTITDANNHTFVTNTYNSEGRVTQQEDVDGNITTFTYDILNHETTVVNPLGNATVYQYDADLRLVGETDALGNIISHTYDGDNNRTSTTDKRGNTTTYTYDSQGNLSSTSNALGFTQSFTYDSDSNLISETDTLNQTTLYRYDVNNNLAEVEDPLGNITAFSYDANGQLISVTDARNATTDYAYNALGYQISVTNALSNTTLYVYDDAGRLQTETDALGRTTNYIYDHLDRLLTVTDPLGGVTTTGYDNVGNRISMTDALGNVTLYTFNGRDQLTSVVDALGGTEVYTYDVVGNRTSVTDASGHMNSFQFDALNRVAAATDPLGNTTTYTFDPDCNQLTSTNALGRTLTATYDVLNRKTSLTNAVGSTTTYTFDGNGNRLTRTDANGRVTQYTYTVRNELASVTDALGGAEAYAYDETGNRVSYTNTLNQTTSYTFDLTNRLISETSPLGHTQVYTYDAVGNRIQTQDANGHVATLDYDDLNRIVSHGGPLGGATLYEYDAIGNVSSRTDGNGNETTMQYDALRRLVEVVDPQGNSYQYIYDAVGNRIEIIDANNNSTHYVYDAAGQLLTVTNALGNDMSFTYDDVGQMSSQTDRNGQTTNYSYDAIGQVSSITYPTSSVQVTYDAVGNRTEVTDSTGTTTYSYDALNRIETLGYDGGEEIGYEYDADGNLAKLIYPDLTEVTYVYDADNRLIHVDNWNSERTSYTYDAVGNILGISHPNDTQTSYVYDANNRVVDLTHTSQLSGTLSHFEYGYDGIGNRTAISTTLGVNTFAYDSTGRLIEAVYGNGEPNRVTYDYDSVGNRIALTEVASGISQTTNYTYDVANQLASTETAGNIVNYVWDSNGNLLNDGVYTYTWDISNRLIGLVDATNVYTYTYNADGWRLSENINGQVKDSLYFTLNDLPYVLWEEQASQTTQHIYSTFDLIAKSEPTGGMHYYHNDILGSIVNQTDQNGQNLASYDYDAFGALRAQNSNQDNEIFFLGEPQDESGLYFLRARYYDPASGRFISRDPLSGRPDNPVTMQPYIYAANNPINLSDKSGASFEEWRSDVGSYYGELGENVVALKDMAVGLATGDELAAEARALMFEDIRSGETWNRVPDAIDRTLMATLEAPNSFFEEAAKDAWKAAEYEAARGNNLEAAAWATLAGLSYSGSPVVDILFSSRKPVKGTKILLGSTEMTIGVLTGERTMNEALEFAINDLAAEYMLIQFRNSQVPELLSQNSEQVFRNHAHRVLYKKGLRLWYDGVQELTYNVIGEPPSSSSH
ncbi:MAG: right-handed parallel beta-helix repeat-containing protein [Chloroflexota bacterium]